MSQQSRQTSEVEMYRKYYMKVGEVNIDKIICVLPDADVSTGTQIQRITFEKVALPLVKPGDRVVITLNVTTIKADE